jgi:hypothetical protein
VFASEPGGRSLSIASSSSIASAIAVEKSEDNGKERRQAANRFLAKYQNLKGLVNRSKIPKKDEKACAHRGTSASSRRRSSSALRGECHFERHRARKVQK